MSDSIRTEYTGTVPALSRYMMEGIYKGQAVTVDLVEHGYYVFFADGDIKAVAFYEVELIVESIDLSHIDLEQSIEREAA